MDWSLSKLLRIESGQVKISTNDLLALLNHYKITDNDESDRLVAMARISRQKSEWIKYKDLAAPEALTYYGYESSASIIRSFEPVLVPGLLQTQEYAREIIGTLGGYSGTDIDTLIELRTKRQELLIRQKPPSLHFILDEAVIRRIVGSPNIMRRQLMRLRELAERPHITMRLVPFGVGVYSHMRMPYVHLEFDDPRQDDILYLEDPFDQLVIRGNITSETQ